MTSFLKPQRPARKIRSLRDVCDSILYLASESIQKKLRNKWPCPTCYGTGKVRDPAERCPIEGYKMADWYTCTSCGGSGETNKEHIQQIYKVHQNKYQEKKAEYERDLALYQSICKKLNSDEIDYIRKAIR